MPRPRLVRGRGRLGAGFGGSGVPGRRLGLAVLLRLSALLEGDGSAAGGREEENWLELLHAGDLPEWVAAKRALRWVGWTACDRSCEPPASPPSRSASSCCS